MLKRMSYAFLVLKEKKLPVLCELSSRRTSGFNFLSAVKFGLKFTLSKSPTQFQPQVTTTSKFDFLKINPYDSLFIFTIQCRCNAIHTQTCFFSNSRHLWFHPISMKALPILQAQESTFFLKLNHQVMKLVDWKGRKNKFWILTASTLISIYPYISVRQYISSIYPSVQIDFGHCPICLIKKVYRFRQTQKPLSERAM